VRFGPDVRFVERGRFDYLSLPRDYVRRTIDRPVFFHLSTLKADDRLIYRECYFDWRERLNSARTAEERDSVADFVEFRRRWVIERFATDDERSLKFRYQRQMAVAHYVRYVPEGEGGYPGVVREAIESGTRRFEIVYKDGAPYLRVDHEDVSMRDYVPSEEDRRWDVAASLRKLLTEEQCARIAV
jgi:hypothetical protein